MGNYYSGMINNENGYGELRHHGILGMKWGVRRYQNKDGSLTPEGRSRYGYAQDEGSKEVSKKFQRYKRVQGTKSLFGGDHTKDKSVEALKNYHNEIYKNRSKLRGLDKDSYRKAVRKIANKHIDIYAKSVLEDMGYESDQKSINWIKQQPWFYMTGASDIVF